jgi:hypothetical protein
MCAGDGSRDPARGEEDIQARERSKQWPRTTTDLLEKFGIDLSNVCHVENQVLKLSDGVRGVFSYVLD